MFTWQQAYEKINFWSINNIPFLVIIDFEGRFPVLLPLSEAAKNGIFYDFRGVTNAYAPPVLLPENIIFEKTPVDFSTYCSGWNKVMKGIRQGESYLLNLTFPTQINTNLTLKQIFSNSTAPYRLLFKDRFTFFSPEPFIRVTEFGEISTYPMKGTISANIPNADQILLNDPKELAEHNTIVDLMRNDLGMHCRCVEVKKFRYLDRITTRNGDIFQTSSEIVGTSCSLTAGILGDIIYNSLPAGSISGAPKISTLKLISEAEIAPRGYYTGICGIYDGCNFDSAVMIRFIEKKRGKFIFRSGGGITINSDVEKEYQEMIDKVYVPFI
ncbi:MAG: aminodeoxychorismate synthase component I [Lentimicrobium sp.]|jgi:para-aminobenzoate synthetase component 1|nr:aminodeoxychorismate synthase component I [Lentimicrobium sp.]